MPPKIRDSAGKGSDKDTAGKGAKDGKGGKDGKGAKGTKGANDGTKEEDTTAGNEAGDGAMPTGEIDTDGRSPEEIDRENALRGAAQLKVVQRQLEVTRSVGKRGEGKNAWRIRDEAAAYKANFIRDDTDGGLAALMDRAMELYDKKEGDVLTEMVDNLRFPPEDSEAASATSEGGDEPIPAADREQMARYEKEARLGLIAREIAKNVRGTTTLGTPLEMLVVRQATQTGPDIDRDLGFHDAPPARRRYDGAPEAEVWNDYAEEHSDWGKAGDSGGRNAAILPTLDSEEGLERWAKWLCTVWALSPPDADHPTHGQATNTDVYFAVGGGELPKETVDNHRAATPGERMWWGAPRTATLLKRSAMQAARGDAGLPTEENPGSLIFTIRRASHLGKAVSLVSQYPEENAMLLPPFALFTVAGNAIDSGNTLGEGLLMDVRPTLPEGAERGGRISEFLQRVRNDAVAATERLEIGKRRRMEEVDPKNTYTYAERSLGLRGGPRHTSIPFDTAWQEMLWVVDRAEEMADDAFGWVGDSSNRPHQQMGVGWQHGGGGGGGGSPQRVMYAWPPPSANPAPVSPVAPAPASPAVARHNAVASARFGPPPVRPHPPPRQAVPPPPAPAPVEAIQHDTPPTAPSTAAAEEDDVGTQPPPSGAAAGFPLNRVASQIGQGRNGTVPWEGGRRLGGGGGGMPRVSPGRVAEQGPVGPAFHPQPQAAAYGMRQYDPAPSSHGSVQRDQPFYTPTRYDTLSPPTHSARWSQPRHLPTQYPVVYPSGRGI